ATATATATATARLGESVANRVPDRLGPALDPDFREDAVHVRLYRRLAEEEPLADLPVGQPLADQREHLGLTRREIIGVPDGRARGYTGFTGTTGFTRATGAAVTEGADETCLDRGVEPGLPAMDRADGGLDLLGARVLGQVPGGPRAQRGKDRI